LGKNLLLQHIFVSSPCLVAGMVLICLQKPCHIPGSNGSLIIAIKPKTKYRFHSDAMLLFYITQNKVP